MGENQRSVGFTFPWLVVAWLAGAIIGAAIGVGIILTVIEPNNAWPALIVVSGFILLLVAIIIIMVANDH